MGKRENQSNNSRLWPRNKKASGVMLNYYVGWPLSPDVWRDCPQTICCESAKPALCQTVEADKVATALRHGVFIGAAQQFQTCGR